MCGGSPSTPAVAAATPEAAQAPDTSNIATSDADKRRRAAAAGQESGRSTILTGSRGTTSTANTQTKTLLGQ